MFEAERQGGSILRGGKIRHVRKSLPFSEKLLDRAEFITFARLLRIRVSEWNTPEEPHPDFNPKSGVGVVLKLGGKTYGSWTTGEDLVVIGYLDAQAVVKEMIERGEMVETGSKILDLKVYTAKRVKEGEDERVWFLAMPATGEIIAAESEKTLSRMVKTGRGLEVSMAGDDRFKGLEASFSYLGHQLEWNSSTDLLAAIVDYAEKTDELLDPAELSRHRNSTGRSRIFREKTKIYDLSNPAMVEHEISFYVDEDAAREAEKNRRAPRDPYSAAMERARTYRVDGNMLIVSITHDEATRNSLMKAGEELERLNKERELRREKEKKK